MMWSTEVCRGKKREIEYEKRQNLQRLVYNNSALSIEFVFRV